MKRDYDLFEQLPDGGRLWRRRVQGLLEAQRELVELSKTTKNDCFAMHLRTKEIVARAHAGQTIRDQNSTTDWRE
jgi:hypothetical protein